MTKEEFVEMLTIMSRRSLSGSVIAARHRSDVGSEEDEDWASLMETIHGRIYIDDSDQLPRREVDRYGQQQTVTDLYALDEIGTWPEGLFRKLSRYIWWIADEDKIPLLDVIAETPKGSVQV